MKVIYLILWVRENVLIKFMVRISSHVEMRTSAHVYTKYNVVPALKVIVDTIYLRQQLITSLKVKKELTGELETYGSSEFVQVV